MVRPKKHLGQHFLTDPSIAFKVAAAIPQDARYLLEVGPGKGALTEHLYNLEDKEIVLCEYDHESVSYLRGLDYIQEASLVQGDFLKMDLEGLFPGRFWIVGNFPYNISSQILFRMYEHAGQVEGLVGMFQKEVALRVAAKPGNKVYGILSVLLQSLYKVEYLFSINEGSFFPPPKVKSAVIRLSRDPSLPGPVDPAFFLRLVKTAFNQRRKTLRNALKPILPPGRELPESIGSRRAEQLSVGEFLELAGLIVEDV